MSDEVFRLTPLDVRKQEFKKTMRGYDPFYPKKPLLSIQNQNTIP